MKKYLSLIVFAVALTFGTAHAADTCDAQAAEKKLAGAAKTSFVKKCKADSGGPTAAACEKSAADKKLAGAAKTSHLKKCMEDAKPMAEAKSADTKPAAASAKPAASMKK